MSYFEHIPAIRYEGRESESPFAYRHYDRNKLVLGKRMEEHLRLAVCYWHTFVWPGVDMFGAGHVQASVAAGGRCTRARASEGRCGVRILLEARHAVLYLPRYRRRRPKATSIRDYSEQLPEA